MDNMIRELAALAPLWLSEIFPSPRSSEMLDAASNGNVSKVERMLARGVSSSCADYDKRTALMVAAQGGHDAVVRVLIENQCDIFAVDIFGTNALLGCIRRSHVACVDLLVAAGLTLHTCTGILMDEVVELLVSGDTAQLERYLAAGIDVNFAHGYNKCSLLHYAALEGFLQAVQIVVEKGADILLENVRDIDQHDGTHFSYSDASEFTLSDLISEDGSYCPRRGQACQGPGRH